MDTDTNNSLLRPRPRLRVHNLAISIIGVLAVVIWGSVVVISTRAATRQLYLAPTTGTVMVDNTIAVQIRVDAGSETVNAVQANLTYDPTKLEYMGVDGAGSAFGLAAATKVTSGSLEFARASQGGEVPATGDVIFATVTFKALSGSGSTSVLIAAGSHVIRSTDNTDILIASGDATYSLMSPVTPTPVPSVTPTPAATPVPTATPRPTATPLAANGKLFLAPSSMIAATGARVVFEVREDSGTTAVNAVQANLTYDPARLEYVGTDSNGSLFDLVAVTANTNGLLSLTRGVSGGNTALTGNQLIAKVTFKTLAVSGQTPVGFAADSAIASANGTDITREKIGATLTITSPVAVGVNPTPGSTPAATTKPIPATVTTAVAGAKKPVKVAGMIKLTSPTSSLNTTVAYTVDNKLISSDTVDTTTLKNGMHTITATSGTQTIQQKLIISNNATTWDRLVAGAHQNAPVATLALGIIVGFIVLLFLAQGIMTRLARKSSLAAAHMSVVHGATPSPAVPLVVPGVVLPTPPAAPIEDSQADQPTQDGR